MTESFQAESRKEWRKWLAEHHERTAGIWLITFKKEAGSKHVPYNDAVEEALCYGWIDSKPRKLDEERTMLWFAPRKPKTNWSKLNKDRVEKLIAGGLMTPAGLKKIESAKKDGSWDALNPVDLGLIPDDLMASLREVSEARQNFEAFPKSARRGILEWIGNAKTSATRRKRIEETARLAGENIRANQWRPPAKRQSAS